eukprot:1014262-Prorocentrum_lima.AAC.1
MKSAARVEDLNPNGESGKSAGHHVQRWEEGLAGAVNLTGYGRCLFDLVPDLVPPLRNMCHKHASPCPFWIQSRFNLK